LGEGISRDPIGEEEGGPNLYGFVGNDPVQIIDLHGLRWYVFRNRGPKAEAIAEAGDTVADLANLIGLDAAEYERWLTASSGSPMPNSSSQAMTGCEKFEVPNTVVAYWGGAVGGVGRWYVRWNSSVKYLRERGFKVDERHHQKGDKMRLTKILALESIGKELHGLYFWGHGYAPYPSSGLLSHGSWDPLLYYSSTGLYYHMALGLVFACDSNSGKTALMSTSGAAIWHGYTGTLNPFWPPFQPFHVNNFIEPGQQETW
jgi:hypothetical protein